MFVLKKKRSFHPKVLVWIAITARGMSLALIRPSKSEAINSHIYVNKFCSDSCFHSSGSLTKTSTTCSGPIMRVLIILELLLIGLTKTSIQSDLIHQMFRRSVRSRNFGAYYLRSFRRMDGKPQTSIC